MAPIPQNTRETLIYYTYAYMAVVIAIYFSVYSFATAYYLCNLTLELVRGQSVALLQSIFASLIAALLFYLADTLQVYVMYNPTFY
jgi:hypothetical protein